MNNKLLIQSLTGEAPLKFDKQENDVIHKWQITE